MTLKYTYTHQLFENNCKFHKLTMSPLFRFHPDLRFIAILLFNEDNNKNVNSNGMKWKECDNFFFIYSMYIAFKRKRVCACVSQCKFKIQFEFICIINHFN